MKNLTILLMFIAIQVKSESFIKQINADLNGDGKNDRIDIFHQQERKKDTETYPSVAIVSLKMINGFIPIKIFSYCCDKPKAFDIRVMDFNKKTGKEIVVGEYGVGALHLSCHISVYTIENRKLVLIAEQWFIDKTIHEISIKDFNKRIVGTANPPRDLEMKEEK